MNKITFYLFYNGNNDVNTQSDKKYYIQHKYIYYKIQCMNM